MIPFAKISHSILDDHDRLAITTHIATTLASNSTQTDGTLNNFHSTFTSLEDTLNSIMNRSSASPLTNDINDLHKQRLDCISGINTGINFFINHESPELVTAAKQIQELYDNYLRNLPNKKKLTYTRAIKNFLEAIKTDAIQDALSKLFLLEKISLLVTSQNVFIQLTRERAEAEEMEDAPHLQETRSELHKMFEVLENHLYYQQYIGSDYHEELAQKLNGRISEIMTIARSRHTHELNDELDEIMHEESGVTAEEFSI